MFNLIMHGKFGGFGAVVLVIGLALFALVTFFVLKYSVVNTPQNTTQGQNITQNQNEPNFTPTPTSSPLGDGFDNDTQNIDKKINDLNTDLVNVDSGMNDKPIDIQQ